MSTAELKRLIDERSPDERRWMKEYLLEEMSKVPELVQTVEELTDEVRRRQWIRRLTEHADSASTGKSGGPTVEEILEDSRAERC